MKIYNSIEEYLPNAKKNDLMIFEGKGLMSGFDCICKYLTYKLISATTDKLTLKGYRSRNNSMLSTYNFNQRVAILTKNEFNKLSIY